MKEEAYWELEKEGTFDAAHFLPFHKGKCHNEHGHSFRWKVKIVSKYLDKDGLIVDFGDIKEVMSKFDHTFINKELEKRGEKINSTAEELSRYFAELLVDMLREKGVSYERIEVSLWETVGSKVTYITS